MLFSCIYIYVLYEFGFWFGAFTIFQNHIRIENRISNSVRFGFDKFGSDTNSVWFIGSVQFRFSIPVGITQTLNTPS